MPDTDPSSDVAALTVQLLSAYLANNTIASDDLAELIRTTRAALTGEVSADSAPVEAETFTPAVSVRKSLASSAYIVSLIDGRPYKTLKRHLASHGLTPETYRSRYNLPASYPMVAPDYAAQRREVAQKTGLGGRKRTPEAQTEESASASVDLTPAASEASEVQPVGVTEDARKTRGRSKAGAKSGGESLTDGEKSEDAAPVAGATKKRATTSKKAAAKTTSSPRASKTGEAKPVAARAKSKSSASKSQTDATEDAGALSTNTPEQNNGSDASASGAEKPKRRGRISLFKKAADTSDAAPEQTAGDDASASNPQPKAAPGKTSKTKRMARASSANIEAADQASESASAND